MAIKSASPQIPLIPSLEYECAHSDRDRLREISWPWLEKVLHYPQQSGEYQFRTNKSVVHFRNKLERRNFERQRATYKLLATYTE